MQVLAWPVDNGSNPYTTLVHEDMGSNVNVDEWPGNLLKKYSVWHMHWPDHLLNDRNLLRAIYKTSGMFAAIDCLRLRGTKIVWTMHNLHSHESFHPTLERMFWRRFIPRVDGAISLSAAGLQMAMKQFPRLREIPTTIIPHGHYRAEYPPSSVDARRSLGIPEQAKVFMFFGAVRDYKNVDALVRAFRKVTISNAFLYVSGVPSSRALAEAIMQEAGQDSRVRVKFEFVKVRDVTTNLSAADLVVLPYREVLNSGSALLALSCNRPILVPDLGAMSELQADYGDEWVRTFSGPLDEHVLEKAMQWAQQARSAVCPVPEEHNWHSIRSNTVQFYETVISHERS
jgi:beta-1,4-mannosyltransferase